MNMIGCIYNETKYGHMHGYTYLYEHAYIRIYYAVTNSLKMASYMYVHMAQLTLVLFNVNGFHSRMAV